MEISAEVSKVKCYLCNNQGISQTGTHGVIICKNKIPLSCCLSIYKQTFSPMLVRVFFFVLFFKLSYLDLGFLMNKFKTCNLATTLPLYICVIVLKFVVVTLPFSEDLFNIDSCRDRYNINTIHVCKIFQITNFHSSSVTELWYHGQS